MEVNFVKPPGKQSSWVLYPLFAIGNVYDHPPDTRIDLKGELTDKEIADVVHQVCSNISSKKVVHALEDDGLTQTKILTACFLQSWFKWDADRALCYTDSCLKSLDSNANLESGHLLQVKRYRRPQTVLICGDRNSSVCFEEMLSFELKNLPRYSVIVRGGCKGVDLYAAELAKLRGLETREYPADWDRYGYGAGPIRNKKMLDSENIDFVLAFHPDISASKGTKDMMIRAYDAHIPVYIHDLKRKMKFEGNFDVL